MECNTPVSSLAGEEIGMMTKRGLVCLLACALAHMVGLWASVSAQGDLATVTGRVFDPNAAVIVEATVTARNVDTGIETVGQTNEDGIYRFVNLGPGNYEFSVSKRGFKVIVKPDVTLHVADTVSMNFSMQVGDVNETVRVEGGAPLVTTENAAVSTVIDRNFAENLPLNGRSFNTLLQLTPGVVIAAGANTVSPGQFSIAGQRTDANNFTVDGVSANFGIAPTLTIGESGTGTAQAFTALGGTSSLVSVDALQEFRIETSSSSPEFGRSSGGQISLTTRSGTNDFHGGIFDYFRNTAMDANDWFNNATSPPVPRAPEHHNDFGGVLGGPISKDKTFFFVSYEGARLALPKTQLIQVPSTFARTQAPATLAPFLNAYPQPNGQPASPTAYTAPFTGSFSNRGTLDAGSIRVDHTFNNRFSIFGRFSDTPSEFAFRSNALSYLQTAQVNTKTLTIGLNTAGSSRIANTLRGNYSKQNSRTSLQLDSFGGAMPLDPTLLLGGLPAASTFLDFSTRNTRPYFVGDNASNQTQQMNIVDTLSWTLGVHQFKFGGDYRGIYLDKQPGQHQLLYSAATLQSFLSPGPRQGKVTLNAQTLARGQLLTPALSLYGQDTWKASPRLTLTYGLRWELDPAPSARGKTTLTAWENVNDPANLALAPSGTPLWSTTYANFAPRLGIAYSLTQKGDFVARVGGGIFYDLGLGQSSQLTNTFPNSARKLTPNLSVPLANATPFLPTLSLQPPFPDLTSGFSPNLTLPRSYQWNLAIEKSFLGRDVLSVTYVGQAGRDLLRQQALSMPNSNFLGDFLLWTEDAFSNYDALQVQYRKPLAPRLQALLSYTWSHSLDNSSNDSIAALSNAIISAARDYASSNFDVRHSFSGAVNYAIPRVARYRPLSLLTKEWSISAIVIIRSGFPFNGLLGNLTPDPSFDAFSRPDRVPGQPSWIAQPGAPGGKILNVTLDPITGAITGGAFALPPLDPVTGAASRQGTEARNDIRGFGLTQVDLSIDRKFPITERVNLQFRADAFNVFNHPNFANPGAVLDAGDPSQLQAPTMLNQGLRGLNPLFQEGGPRSLQLSLRVAF